MFEIEFLEFLSLLKKHRVEYMVIGGVAVNIYGYSRSTGDIDIWMKPDNANGERIIAAIEELGYAADELKDKDFESAGIFFLGQPPFRIDVLTQIKGIRFDEAYRNKLKIEVEGVVINIIGLDDLKLMKLISGRPKDIDDIHNLNKII